MIFDAVNENLPEIIESFGSDTRKIFANEYIDDRNTRPLKDDSYNILYLCDGREYMYTSDVSHAKNFVKGAYDLYWEKENNEEKTTDTNSYGESTENKCKYCTSHMNTLLEYCKCLYKLEGCEAGGLLHSLLDDNNMDDGSITDCMKLCLRHPEMEEAELGILICKEFLKMSMKERLAFDRLGYGWNGECYKKKDCEECSICNLSGEC